MDNTTKVENLPKHVDSKKLEVAIKALEMIHVLGDSEWKRQRAREALFEIERIKK